MKRSAPPIDDIATFVAVAHNASFTRAAEQVGTSKSNVVGFGIAQIYDRVAAPHLRLGEIVHLLPEIDVEGPPVHALIPVGRQVPPKTRVTLDALAGLFRAPISRIRLSRRASSLAGLFRRRRRQR